MEEWIIVSPGRKLILNLPALINPLAILNLAQHMPCYPIYLLTHPTTLLNYIPIAHQR